ncbi:hypothetical protein [Halalkalicoccus jeotgali]|nr:hypothetical protein [Halalkalicoccus jeotgali]
MAERETRSESAHERPTKERTTAFLARGIVRTGLVVLGTVLLLFALGQAFGLDLLGALADFVGTQTGRWLAVAFFALVIISVAASGWRYRRPPA